MNFDLKRLFGFLILFVPLIAEPYLYEDYQNIKLTPFSLAYSWECSLSREFKMLSNAQLSYLGYPFSNENWSLSPRVSIESRLYYNLLERKKAGRNIDNFAANYLAFSFNYGIDYYIAGTSDPGGYLSMGPKWGFRRSVSERLYYDGNIGLGLYIFEVSPSAVGFWPAILPMGTLEIGWRLD